eukprot:366189-Chlamydomonas_euryale.AAC.3
MMHKVRRIATCKDTFESNRCSLARTAGSNCCSLARTICPTRCFKTLQPGLYGSPHKCRSASAGHARAPGVKGPWCEGSHVSPHSTSVSRMQAPAVKGPWCERSHASTSTARSSPACLERIGQPVQPLPQRRQNKRRGNAVSSRMPCTACRITSQRGEAKDRGQDQAQARPGPSEAQARPGQGQARPRPGQAQAQPRPRTGKGPGQAQARPGPGQAKDRLGPGQAQARRGLGKDEADGRRTTSYLKNAFPLDGARLEDGPWAAFDVMQPQRLCDLRFAQRSREVLRARSGQAAAAWIPHVLFAHVLA